MSTLLDPRRRLDSPASLSAPQPPGPAKQPPGPAQQHSGTAVAPVTPPPNGLAGAVRPTLILDAPRLSRILGASIVLASETFQFTGSFKFRAALNLARNVPNPRILTASSGNFGQAMALACTLTGKSSLIVMPHTAAHVKVDGVRFYGGTVDFVDTRVTTRAARVDEMRAAYPDAYVASPFDDPLVIAGNSSLGEELAAGLPRDCTTLVTPVGGGGLASGLVEGLRRAGRALTIYGAEPALANDASRSFRAGHIVSNASEPPTIADGARTLSIGSHNWPLIRDGLADILEVPEPAIAEAVRLIFTHTHLKAEPTGALSLAAVLAHPDRFRDQTVCCIVSGGNVDSDVFRRLLADEPLSRSSTRINA